jgi:hypothetical protein
MRLLERDLGWAAALEGAAHEQPEFTRSTALLSRQQALFRLAQTGRHTGGMVEASDVGRNRRRDHT